MDEVGQGNNVDPEALPIISQYSQTVRGILAKRVYNQFGDIDEGSSVSKAALLQALSDLNAQTFQKDISDKSISLKTATDQLTALQKRIKDATDSARSCRAKVCSAY